MEFKEGQEVLVISYFDYKLSKVEKITSKDRIRVEGVNALFTLKGQVIGAEGWWDDLVITNDEKEIANYKMKKEENLNGNKNAIKG